jgi:hypothetical protein
VPSGCEPTGPSVDNHYRDRDSCRRGFRDSRLPSARDRYYGRDAYDFGEVSLNTAAFRTARAGKIDDALALLRLIHQTP